MMVPVKAQTKVQPTEAESSPKVSGKAQRKESLKADLTSTVSEKASQKKPLKAERRPKGPGRTMVLLKAPWNSTVRVKAQTKAYPTQAESLLMVPVKAQTKVQPTEAVCSPKVSGKAQRKESLKAALTSTVSEKASQQKPLKAERRPKGPGRTSVLLRAPWN